MSWHAAGVAARRPQPERSPCPRPFRRSVASPSGCRDHDGSDPTGRLGEPHLAGLPIQQNVLVELEVPIAEKQAGRTEEAGQLCLGEGAVGFGTSTAQS